MPQQQQFRLRLAEGTLLVVDHDALSTWLVDEKALVQPLGSQRWRLLRQFLADERAGIGENYWDEPTVEEKRAARRRERPAKQESIVGAVSGWLTGKKKRPAAKMPDAPSGRPAPMGRDIAPLVKALKASEGQPQM